MSRCFPFPPPGYEKTARADGLAHPLLLLDKEKQKEKKHKKDKDKEKREGKEKKDKERSKDKHKDKKDRKERHKEKKKDKNKDKSRESEEGTERHGEAHHEQKFGESSRKSEDIKDSKFKDELARRIQDEKGAANRPVESFSVSSLRSREGFSSVPPLQNERASSTLQSREGFSSVPPLENERTAVNKMHINSVSVAWKNDGLGQQINSFTQQKNGTAIRRRENGTSLFQRTHENLVVAPTVDKERVKVTKVLPNSTDSTPRKEGMGQRSSNISILVQKRTESPSLQTSKREAGIGSPLLPSPANAVQKGNGKLGQPMEIAPTSVQRFGNPSTSSGTSAGMDRGKPRPTIPSPSITIRRPNGVVRPTESFSISTQKKPDAGGLSPALGKEKDQGGRMLQNNISIDRKQVNSKPSSAEKVADGRAERMEKVRDGAPDDMKKEDKKSDRHDKKKRKDKDKHKEKKKEKEIIKEKEEHKPKEHDKLRENSLDDLIDRLCTLSAHPVEDAKAATVDENIKKRKNHEMNGYLQNHHDMRPTKVSRTALSYTHEENGPASHVAAPLSSMKPDAVNIVNAERLHKQEEKINGNLEAQQSSADSGLWGPLAAMQNGTASKKLPHPDSKYLSQIYSVPGIPQMSEWFEDDDQEWLFDQTSIQSKQPKSESETDGAPHVWVQALKIDTADVVALPYVVPF